MMPILILAAGASSRMRGTDKLTLPVRGVPLLRHQIDTAQHVSRDVRVALPPAPHPRYALARTARQIPVPNAADGLSASLRQLIDTLESHHSHAMILLADLPELTPDDLRQVMDGPHTAPDALIWRGATQEGKPGHPLVLSSALFGDFATLTGDNGGQSIIARHTQQTHLIPLPGQRARRDLDTPEDWADWRASSGDG
ncbi:nucleotidyltransferase family protein [Tateyamaria sp. SN6-1]|uniref:nucleotidyltransferase family protein n=1 Tax=Tateyamaria sp. SN6-1 TaxID=3092148 RepID=UPI0039F4BEE4